MEMSYSASCASCDGPPNRRLQVSVKQITFSTAILIGLSAGVASAAPAVSASSVHPGPHSPKYAVDGNLKTRWASKANTGKAEWLQIDFGRVRAVKNIAICWERAYAAEYQIQVSDDGKTWKTVHHKKDGRGGKDVFGDLSAKGRFLRVLCLKHGPWQLFSIWEIEFPDDAMVRAITTRRRKAEEARRKAEAEARRALPETLARHGVREIIFALRRGGRDHWYGNFGYYSDSKVTKADYSPYETEGRRIAYGDGGKLCRLNLKTGRVKLLVDDAKGGVRDPAVHYDGKKILFSYRPGGTHFYHLYEINIDGTGLKQLTRGPFDDIEPTYMPDGSIIFVSSRCKRWVQCWLTQVAVLYRCDGDGGNLRPISANVEHDNTPWPLPDGRILYQRWEYVDRSQVDYHHLWTANPDGTGQMVYYGNMHPATVMIDAKPIPDTQKVVAIFSPGHGRGEHEGVVTIVDPSKGPDDHTRARSVNRGSNFRDPWAFSENTFLVARGTQILVMDGTGRTAPIYDCSPQNKRGGLQCHEPRPLMARPRERIIPPRIRAEKTTGELVLANVYRGRNMKGVKPGEIKKLLVIESLPKPINFTGGMDPLTYGGSFTLERVVGTVPVEPDGSAYMELPALRSLFFVALDKNDMSVKRMQSFLTVQPGETTGCVGCHEQRTESVIPAGKLTALRRAPSRIEPIDDCPDVFDFPRDVQPILDKLCIGCHDYQKTKQGGPYAGKVALTGDRGPMFSHAYFTMTVRRLFSDGRNEARSNYPPRAIGSSASRILKMLDGSHYGVKATAHQKKMLRLWIEVGAPYPGTYAALGSGMIGGYAQNRLVNVDTRWPTTKAGAQVIRQRCASCHKGHKVLPMSMSDERGMSFWRFYMNDPRFQMSRHIMFNLTRPEKSLLALAPLAAKDGGLELCRDKQGKPAAIFADRNDPDYKKLVAMAAAGRKHLEQIRRFDMPGFRPRLEYVREMKRFGILPADLPLDAAVDPYKADQAYWRSLWYRAPGSRKSSSSR